METKTHTPNFTVSLRGYDREEVDEYLDSLTHSLDNVDDAEQQNRRLQTYVNQLNARIKELEDRLTADPPKSGALLGERIGILLEEAEKAAAEAVATAEGRAAEIMAAAEVKNAQAEDKVRRAVSLAEEQARRIEMAARGEAEEIISEAETRANVRTRQIEQWAEQVVSHTRAEEVRMLKEQQARQCAAAAELKAIADQKALASTTLVDLRTSIDRALAIVGPDNKAPGDEPDAASVVADETSPAPEAVAPEDLPRADFDERDPVDDDSASALADVVEDTEPAEEEFEPDGLVADDDHAGVEDEAVVPADAFYPHMADEVDGPITSEIELRDLAVSAARDDVGFEDWISEGAKSGPQHFRRL